MSVPSFPLTLADRPPTPDRDSSIPDENAGGSKLLTVPVAESNLPGLSAHASEAPNDMPKDSSQSAGSTDDLKLRDAVEGSGLPAGTNDDQPRLLIPACGGVVPGPPDSADGSDRQSVGSRRPASDSDVDIAGPEKWNSSGQTMFRVFATFLTLLIMGANDAVVGALLPYLEEDYHLSYLTVSLLFLTPIVGYAFSAILNLWIHNKFGQRGIAIVTALGHMIAYVIACVRPPFGVYAVALAVAAFGSCLGDGAWNAYIGGLANANELLGLLHGSYGLGGVLGPLVSTFMVADGALKWYNFYYIMVGASAIELVVGTTAFWKSNGENFRATAAKAAEAAADADARLARSKTDEENNEKVDYIDPEKKTAEMESGAAPTPTLDATTMTAEQTEPVTTGQNTKHVLRQCLLTAPHARVSWLAILLFFVCCGAEISFAGWIVTFMLRVRNGSRVASGMAAVGYWVGITVGRVGLGFATTAIGERAAWLIYSVLTIVCHLLFWLIPNFYSSAVTVSLIGFFIGPLFPVGIRVVSKLMPKQLEMTAIALSVAAAGIGCTIFPFSIGALANAKGVAVMEPFMLALLITTVVLILLFPRQQAGWKGWRY